MVHTVVSLTDFQWVSIRHSTIFLFLEEPNKSTELQSSMALSLALSVTQNIFPYIFKPAPIVLGL